MQLGRTPSLLSTVELEVRALAGFIFREQEFNLFAAPITLHLLFLIVGIGIFPLALALLDARLGQYRYARTVNEIRRYFSENDPNLIGFLYLPVTKNIPDMRNLGFVGIQLWFILPIGGLFTAYGIYGLVGLITGPLYQWPVGGATFAVYWLVFRFLRRRHASKYEEMIGHYNGHSVG